MVRLATIRTKAVQCLLKSPT
ncbi:hypothetical protein JMJ77_0009194 [Colletotrichum scovillei]|uniref:Uncharacterized protein n=1 Tax=Colletotrichum scovillei TaxID=1209932 RepID=A0A9P7R023_9PEZI|nr:hypothetical protein JMJ77_0009194 [Colletotrichum scovillei]KAG7052269.1 hypothetical protein JMJ78_0005290 [Colletotrichum scovillei]KAG7064560.1 hypothetical protein JMJ76_0012323 [Colletotrichum scovillei]